LRPNTDDSFIEFNGDEFKGKGNIFKYSKKELYEYRKRVQMIFQNPDASLNPGMKVRELIIEAIESCPKKRYTKVEINEKMKEYLQMMNLQGRESNYPDTLSGGEKRRVGVIRALALEPDLIIADEPFSNLDVSLRNHLINIFQRLKAEKKLSFLFILHDIDIAQYLCNRITVMYLGRIVEIGDKQQIFDEASPKHPYTATLIAASEALKRISVEKDFGWQPPQLIDTDLGCTYRNRCAKYHQKLELQAQSKCEHDNPDLNKVNGNQKIACHFWQK
jgi:oligopeptide/dipeptide ABC transporter ATP-binding protein